MLAGITESQPRSSALQAVQEEVAHGRAKDEAAARSLAEVCTAVSIEKGAFTGLL